MSIYSCIVLNRYVHKQARARHTHTHTHTHSSHHQLHYRQFHFTVGGLAFTVVGSAFTLGGFNFTAGASTVSCTDL